MEYGVVRNVTRVWCGIVGVEWCELWNMLCFEMWWCEMVVGDRLRCNVMSDVEYGALRRDVLRH